MIKFVLQTWRCTFVELLQKDNLLRNIFICSLFLFYSIISFPNNGSLSARTQRSHANVWSALWVTCGASHRAYRDSDHRHYHQASRKRKLEPLVNGKTIIDTITFMYHYASIVNADFSMHFLLSKYKICFPDGWKQQKSHISRELSNYLSREGFRGSDVKLLKLAIIKHFPAAVSCQGLLIQSSPKCKVSHFSI